MQEIEITGGHKWIEKYIISLVETWIVIWQNSLKTNFNSAVINASVNQERYV